MCDVVPRIIQISHPFVANVAQEPLLVEEFENESGIVAGEFPQREALGLEDYQRARALASTE